MGPVNLKLNCIFFTILFGIILGVYCDLLEDPPPDSSQGDALDDDYEQIRQATDAVAHSRDSRIILDGQIIHGRSAKGIGDNVLGANMSKRKKKECGFPVLRRRLFGPIMKRSSTNPHYFANSENEVQEKVKEEDAILPERKKRSAVTESHSGGCVAKRQWIDMGADYYPRYVKSYHCSSTNCDHGFGIMGECKPKHYTTKVLKRITPADTTSVEDCDQTLPEALRVDWKLISVTVTTCCDCVNPARRIFS